jgi:tetratricopeptide (TPR) repeat protein
MSNNIANQLIEANCLKRQKDYRKALHIYQSINKKLNGNIDLLSAIGFCYFAIGDYKNAIEYIGRALANSNDDRLYVELGNYYALGILDYEKAAEAFRTAIEINPYNVKALVNGASLYEVPEEVISLDEAIHWLETATKIESDIPYYHARLGILYYKANRIFEAKQSWYRSLLCTDPLETGYLEEIRKNLE